jgi:hypothetical protein
MFSCTQNRKHGGLELRQRINNLFCMLGKERNMASLCLFRKVGRFTREVN